jgi:hypothetical protein
LEAFIGKAFKGVAVLGYRKPLITPPMGASGSPEGENFLAIFECCRGHKLHPSFMPLNPVPPEDSMLFFRSAKKFSLIIQANPFRGGKSTKGTKLARGPPKKSPPAKAGGPTRSKVQLTEP